MLFRSLNNVSGDYADFGSYNPAQTGYTVVVTGEDGSKITQRLQAGESYNPITGVIDHFGEFSNGVKLADGVKVSAYDVTPDVPYYANATMISGNFSSGLHDVRSGHINILGYLNDSAQYDKEYTTNISISSESKKGNRKIIFKATKDEVRNLPITAELPTSGGFGNDQSVYNLGDILTLSLNAGGTLSNTSIYRPGINLDAGGILEGKPNKTVTDLAGGKWQA